MSVERSPFSTSWELPFDHSQLLIRMKVKNVSLRVRFRNGRQGAIRRRSCPSITNSQHSGDSMQRIEQPTTEQMMRRKANPFCRLANSASAVATTKSVVWDVGYKPTT